MLDGYIILTNGQSFRLPRNTSIYVWRSEGDGTYMHENTEIDSLMGKSSIYGNLHLNGLEVEELLMPVSMRDLTIVNCNFVNKVSLPLYHDMDVSVCSKSKIEISNLHMFKGIEECIITFNFDMMPVPSFEDVFSI